MPNANVVIDLSHFNGKVNLQRAASAGIVGAIHKATQGTGFVDPMFAKNRKAAAAAGLLWGAYHFGTGADPVAQAKKFLQVALPKPNDLVVLDFEPNSVGATMTLAQARTFITTVGDATGRAPGLYGGSLLKQLLGTRTDPLLASCWLWWAQYGPAAVIPPNWPAYTLWQYTDGHHGNPPHAVDGIGACDRDLYEGTEDDLTTRWATGSLA